MLKENVKEQFPLDKTLPPDFFPLNFWNKRIEITGVSVSIITTNLTTGLRVSLHKIPKVISLPSNISQTPALSTTGASRVSRDQSQTGSLPSGEVRIWKRKRC